MPALRLGRIVLGPNVRALGPSVFRLRPGTTALRLVQVLVGLSVFALGPGGTALHDSFLVSAPFRIGL